MTAMNVLAHNLAQSQVIKIESFRQPQLQIEKAVVHAFDGDAHGPAMFFMACLRITRHGKALGMFRVGCMFFAHEEFCGDSRLVGAACAGASISSSANCKSCSRA